MGHAPGRVSGADLVLVEAAQRLARERSAFRADQFRRPGNCATHEATTGPEIWEAKIWEAAGGRLDAFVDFAGSGGTFAGVVTALRGSRATWSSPRGRPCSRAGPPPSPATRSRAGATRWPSWR